MPTAQDISRSTTNVLLPAEVSTEIWAKTLEESAIGEAAGRARESARETAERAAKSFEESAIGGAAGRQDPRRGLAARAV